MLEQQIEFWRDPRVLGLEDIGGPTMTAKEIAVALEARIKELRRLMHLISK